MNTRMMKPFTASPLAQARTGTHATPKRLLGGALMMAALASPCRAGSQALSPVNLRSTAHFAVLGGSLVSNIPNSAITGDIGLSPAAGSKITGFGATEVTGTIYTADATGPAGSVTAASDLTTAKGDLTLAYNDAAGRTPIPAGEFLNPGAGNLGGKTLVPGLYKFTGAAAITGSDLVLSGGANDVWIFQIASELDVGSGIKVTLAGGALAANVFWQVGTSATLGTTSAFKGTILADQSISMNTGATLDGRALASIAAVTLAGSTVKRPDPAPNAVRGLLSRNTPLRQDTPYGFHAATGMRFMSPFNSGTTLGIMDPLGREIGTLQMKQVTK